MSWGKDFTEELRTRILWSESSYLSLNSRSANRNKDEAVHPDDEVNEEIKKGITNASAALQRGAT